jgi:putative transposase
MPDYRRFRVPGGTYFFTVNLLERRLDTLVRHIDVLREAVRLTKRERPFHIDAWVVLPDHMHCVWTLPPGDDDFSNRWKAIKIRFVQKIPAIERRSRVRAARHERGVWQRCFLRLAQDKFGSMPSGMIPITPRTSIAVTGTP